MIAASAFGSMVIAFVFLASAVSKISGRARWLSYVAATRSLAPHALRESAAAMAALVAAAEICVAVLTAFPGTRRAGITGAATLLIVFTAALAHAIRARSTTTCACFGGSTRSVGPQHLWRNCLLLLTAGLAWLSSQATPTFGYVEWAVLGVLAAIVAASFARWDSLTDLLTP